MVLKSEDVNYLVYRYLKESGFLHSSYIFQFESQIHSNDRELPNVEPGSLIRVLQKGLQYMDVETHLNEDGTARLCTAPFSLVGKHVCSVQSSASATLDVSGVKRGTKNGTPSQQQQQLQQLQRIEESVSDQNSVASNHGGHTLVHDGGSAKDAKKQPKARNIVIQHQANAATEAALATNGATDDDADQMDVDVPDTEKEAHKGAVSDAGKSGRKLRLVEQVQVQVLHGHTSPVFLCAWAPSSGGNVLATGAGDGTARIWDLLAKPKGDGVQSLTLRHDPPPAGRGNDGRLDVTSIVWNPSGTLLATACFGGQICVWTAAGEQKHMLRHRPVPVISMRWNRKGSLLLSACLDGSICLWDIKSGSLRHEHKAHSGSVLDIDWLDNTTFASCAADKSIIVWREDSVSPVKTFTGHKSDVNAIKWHPSGKYLASASDDGTVKIWSLSSDTAIHDFFGHSQQVYAVKWLPRSDKSIVASASFDGTVRIWDLVSDSCLRVLSAHTEAVHCLAFSSDGRFLASGSFDRKVRIWNVKDGSLFKTYCADDGIHDVQWAPKGKIAVAVANGLVVVFDPLVS
ncbi:hypothetical protein GGH99_000394 [Coemansia sp. RSA 1285]|nr:hypothetical protein GGH99_000394 [Coemansia sp. RSA 1285]